MGLIGNILWFIFGGCLMGLGWWLAGLLAAVTIVGIPFGIQNIKLALVALAPIGKTIVEK
ncbi:MAG: hypothetical protein IPN53_23335 [Comamonadaceae bacterium]|nr:hypothetical protein [Comamonadaceae bacterium]